MTQLTAEAKEMKHTISQHGILPVELGEEWWPKYHQYVGGHPPTESPSEPRIGFPQNVSKEHRAALEYVSEPVEHIASGTHRIRADFSAQFQAANGSLNDVCLFDQVF